MIDATRYTSLGELLEDALHTWPADLAVIEADRDREAVRLTYAGFRAGARRVSAWLQGRGFSVGDRVAIAMSNQAAWLLSAAGALHLGLVLVPLDARLTVPELRALLAHAGAQALVTDAHLARDLGDVGVPVLASGNGPLPPHATRFTDLPDAPGPIPLVPRARADLACIVYSSGTGGDPKGCKLSHGAYLAQYQALTEVFEWRRGDRYLSILPTNHAIDFMCGFIASLATGATIIHQRTLRPEHILSTMRRYRVTQMSVVPMILKAFERSLRERLDEQPADRRRLVDGLIGLNRALTRRAPRQGLSRWLLKPVHDAFGGHLRILYCGGAFTERETVELFNDLGLPVAVGYGLTEACTVITVNNLKPARADSVGAPLPGVEVRVANPGPDGVGEVQVRGETVFSGYLDAPELTEAAFDDGWLRTGDLGWFDGAWHLHLVGRQKNLIVTAGGKNVYPEDVEGAFAGLPCEELAVMAENYVWPKVGEGAMVDERLIVLIRPGARDEAALSAQLRALNRGLPEHKRVSAWLRWDHDFPRTTSLKVKRADLAAAVRTGARPEALHPVTA
jgi:long-chain acyl-CoA synthetase